MASKAVTSALARRAAAGVGRKISTPALSASVRAFSTSENQSYASGQNAVYLESIYKQWKADKSSVEPRWTATFEALEQHRMSAFSASKGSIATSDLTHSLREFMRAYQVRGHEAANVDPLNLKSWMDRDFIGEAPELDAFFHGITEADMKKPAGIDFPGLKPNATVGDFIAQVRKVYAGSVGVEFMHMGDLKKINWIRERIERPDFIPSDKKKLMEIYEDLAVVNCFEEFLNNKYKTTKRFGVDGAEATVSGLNAAVEKASTMGVDQCVIGMPHRGRLNILRNVVGKDLTQMFAEFKGTHYDFDRIQQELENEDWSMAGDVKYHLGTSGDKQYRNGKVVTMTLEANPSHLETVNSVTLGRVKAKQYYMGNDDASRKKVLPILLHGDASFAGQGVVYETMQLAKVKEFDVGGTIHVVVNNQVGFTTDPSDDRSTMYCSDIGKAFNVPIFHCNADDPIAVSSAFELAAEWRQTFGMDVIIDVVGYRRYGHNETDAPEYTQPVLYKQINKHPRSETLMSNKLTSSGVATQQDLSAIKENLWAQHEKSFDDADTYKEQEFNWLATKWEGLARPIDPSRADPTGVQLDLLQKIGVAISSLPDGFKPHPGLKRQLKKKAEDLVDGTQIDWATAEALAFGSLLLEGKHVRITGQDVQRGTFAHRHAVIKDQATGKDHCFLNNLNLGKQEQFVARNSILSEYAVLGYELGYSYENPHQLNIWEAQFGDFANTAQVMFDQFIAAGESKWMAQSGLTMLLPHGYMGQGAEHSSCRLERFLQMCDDDEDDIPSFTDNDFGREQAHKANWQVCHLSTPANYFHALRRQLNRNFRKPLVVASPKNLFRLKQCVSSMAELGPESHFRRVIDERDAEISNNADKVDRLIFCSGKFYYELAAEREARGLKNIAIVTLEQIAPFPFDRVKQALEKYKNVDVGDGVRPGNVLWCQEEPKNMGPWSYVKPRITTSAREGLNKDLVVRYVGRRAAASPATGLPKLHNAEQESVITEAIHGHEDNDFVKPRPSSFLGHQT